MATPAIFLVLFICLTALVGCGAVPPVQIGDESDRPLRIYGEVTEAHQTCISNALSFLPEKVRNSAREVHIRSDLEHYEYFYKQTIKRCAAGHNCARGGRKICLRPLFIDFQIVWHEVAHVYTLTIKDSGRLLLEWTKIAGSVYVDNYEDYMFDDPSDGALSWYGRRDSLEDIAVWVEKCMFHLYVNKENWVLFNEKNKHFKTDDRYRRKLACLYKYGFISESDYNKLKPLFE